METEKEMTGSEEVTLQGTIVEENSRNLGEAVSNEHHHDAMLELEEAHKPVDYASLSKAELVAILKDVVKETDFRKVDVVLKETKHHFDEIRNREREEALARFVADGGKRDDFEYRQPEIDVTFDANFKLLRDKRNQYVREQEELKNTNHLRKTELLEKLRALTDAEDSEYGFHAFKEIQREWKSIGAVPNAFVKPLWANYTALVDRFYDNRSIYFELKELDRRKNLEAKIELCVKAEKLLTLDRLTEAVKELNELHHEFKHVGPVPKDEKEHVWQRFKAASDKIYARRDEHLEKINQELGKNLEEKIRLANELAGFASFQSDRIKEWNQKTQEILAFQKQWEAAGNIPRSKAKEVNKKFWSAFKSFFNSKNAFFKKLDEERSANLLKKTDLVNQARALNQSSDWQATAEALKELQRKWKDIGPVPEKARERIFQEFKQACDFFFEQRRNQYDKQDEDQRKNLEQKELICSELETLAASKGGTREQLTELMDRFNALGFVPKKSINPIKARFQKAVDSFIASLEGLSEEERGSIQLETELGNLKNDPQSDRKLHQREQGIRKKIVKAENDLAILRNNLEFFGRSKNAEKLKAEFSTQIKEASEQVAALKSQLKMLKTVS